MITASGSFIFAGDVLVTLWNLLDQSPARRARRRQSAGRGDARMVRAVTPIAFNFRRIPVIASRHPLWEAPSNESALPVGAKHRPGA